MYGYTLADLISLAMDNAGMTHDYIEVMEDFALAYAGWVDEDGTYCIRYAVYFEYDSDGTVQDICVFDEDSSCYGILPL